MERKEIIASASLPQSQNVHFCVTLSEVGTKSRRSSALEDFFFLIEDSSIAWVDLKVENLPTEAVNLAGRLGFSELLVKQLLTRLVDSAHFQGGYEDFDIEMGLLFPAIAMKDKDLIVNPLLILLKKGLVVTIRSTETHIFHNMHRYAETFLKRLPQNQSSIDLLTLLLIRIIDENNERNFERFNALIFRVPQG